MTSVLTVFATLKYYIPLMFTKDKGLLKYIAIPWFIALGTMLGNGFQFFLGSVLKGCGLQRFGGGVAGASYGVIGIPIAVTMVIVLRMGVFGYEIGLVAGGAVATITYAGVIICIDWEKRSKVAQRLAKVAPDVPNHSEENHIAKDKEMVNNGQVLNLKSALNGSLEKKECLASEEGTRDQSLKVSYRVLSVQVVITLINISIMLASMSVGRLFIYQREPCYLNATIESLSNSTEATI